MRSLRLPFAASIALLAAASHFVACTSDDETTPSPTTDAAADVVDATANDPDTNTPLPLPDADTVKCTLDNGSDPVAFCIQKLVLQGENEGAFSDAGGVAASWDSITGLPGNAPHDFHDDVAFAAALSHYFESAEQYGDGELHDMVVSDMLALAAIIERELATLPADYDGALYADLRSFAGGLNFLNEVGEAAKINAIAEAYGKGIFTYFQLVNEVPIPLDAGADPDAGSDASAGDDSGDAAIADAGTDGDAAAPSDAGTPLPDGVLGVVKNGHVDYDVQKAATGALALFDLASRHSADDAGADIAADLAWQRAARSTLDHIWNRARQPQLGLVYSKLTTSGIPFVDALQAGVDHPDMLETDTQGVVSLTFLRARALADANPKLTLVDIALFESRGEAIIDALNATPSFWDTTPLPTNDGGSGFFEGYVPSTSTMVRTKPIRGNALLLAALHRASKQTPARNAHQTSALLTAFKALYPRNTSFLTVAPNQTSYLARTSADFDYPGDDAGPADGATLYTSASNHAACDGLNDLWFGENGH